MCNCASVWISIQEIGPPYWSLSLVTAGGFPHKVQYSTVQYCTVYLVAYRRFHRSTCSILSERNFSFPRYLNYCNCSFAKRKKSLIMTDSCTKLRAHANIIFCLLQYLLSWNTGWIFLNRQIMLLLLDKSLQLLLLLLTWCGSVKKVHCSQRRTVRAREMYATRSFQLIHRAYRHPKQ